VLTFSQATIAALAPGSVWTNAPYDSGNFGHFGDFLENSSELFVGAGGSELEVELAKGDVEGASGDEKEDEDKEATTSQTDEPKSGQKDEAATDAEGTSPSEPSSEGREGDPDPHHSDKGKGDTDSEQQTDQKDESHKTDVPTPGEKPEAKPGPDKEPKDKRKKRPPTFHNDPDAAWEHFHQAFRTSGIVWSASSVLSSTIILTVSWWVPGTRRTPGWLILRADICDLCTSICFSVLFWMEDIGERGWSTPLAYSVSVFNVAAYGFRAMMYMYLLTIYRNPFQPERHRFQVYLWVFVLSISFGFYEIWVGEEWFFFNMIMGLFVIPFLVFFLGGGVVILVVVVLVCCNRKSAAATRTRRGTPTSTASPLNPPTTTTPGISNLARQRVMRHGNVYFFLFGLRLVLGIVLCFAIYYYEAERNFPWFRDVVVILAAGGPVFTLFGWLIVNFACSKRLWCCQSSDAGPTLSSNGGLVRGPSRPEMHRRARESQGIEEGGFKEELRFELLFNVTKSLGVLAKEEMIGKRGRTGTGTSFHSSFPAHIEMRTMPDNGGDEDDMHCMYSDKTSPVSWDLGARGSAEPISDSQLTPATTGTRSAPVGRRNSMFAALVQRNESADTQVSDTSFADGCEECRVKHYGTPSFRSIRDAFGFARQLYARSFPNDLTSLSTDWRSKLKERVSEGKSGCFFYRVMNNDGVSKLIVKQITEQEKITLLRILPAYEGHVRRRRGKSFICYFGCHSMRLSWTLSRKVYFVVMRNFLPADMWLVFDLKGATANRRALAEDFLYRKGEEGSSKRSYGTLRDWEWLDIAMSVDVNDEDRNEIRMIIQEDSKFMSEMNLLDYSLLLGIHRVPKDLKGAPRQAHIQKLRSSGGYVSVDQQKVYFFGIIDILENYNCRWRMQQCLLKTAYHLFCWSRANGISAIPPRDYADRFKTFVEREVLHCHRLSSSGNDGGNQTRTFGSQEDLSSSRWTKLWSNRQQGLVRERMEVENEDRMASYEEQTERLRTLSAELRLLKGEEEPRMRRPRSVSPPKGGAAASPQGGRGPSGRKSVHRSSRLTTTIVSPRTRRESLLAPLPGSNRLGVGGRGLGGNSASLSTIASVGSGNSGSAPQGPARQQSDVRMSAGLKDRSGSGEVAATDSEVVASSSRGSESVVAAAIARFKSRVSSSASLARRSGSGSSEEPAGLPPEHA